MRSCSCYCTGSEHLQRSEDLKRAVHDGTKEHTYYRNPCPQTSPTNPRTHLFPTDARARRRITRRANLSRQVACVQRAHRLARSNRQKASAGVTFPGRCGAVEWTWKKGCSQAPSPLRVPADRPLSRRICIARRRRKQRACCLVRRGRDVT